MALLFLRISRIQFWNVASSCRLETKRWKPIVSLELTTCARNGLPFRLHRYNITESGNFQNGKSSNTQNKSRICSAVYTVHDLTRIFQTTFEIIYYFFSIMHARATPWISYPGNSNARPSGVLTLCIHACICAARGIHRPCFGQIHDFQPESVSDDDEAEEVRCSWHLVLPSQLSTHMGRQQTPTVTQLHLTLLYRSGLYPSLGLLPVLVVAVDF